MDVSRFKLLVHFLLSFECRQLLCFTHAARPHPASRPCGGATEWARMWYNTFQFEKQRRRSKSVGWFATLELAKPWP